MSYLSRYNEEIRKLREENNSTKKTYLDKITQISTILIPVVAGYFGFLQYLYNQNIIDKRKYNNLYYDERIKILRSITKSVGEIKLLMEFNGNHLSKKDTAEVRNELTGFFYAKIALDKGQTLDNALLYDLNTYEKTVSKMVLDSDEVSLHTLNTLSDKIPIECGNILRHEKDTINSYNFKLVPIGLK